MRFEVVISADAERDIADIVGYIAAIERACSGLAGFPHRGNFPKELVSLGIREYREAHFKPYRIVNRVMERRVVVYCVLDGRRDMQTLLQLRLLR